MKKNVYIIAFFIFIILFTSCSCIPFQDIPYQEHYLEVDHSECFFTQILEPHKDEWGLEYQFQIEDGFPIEDAENYQIALEKMTSTQYRPLTEQASSQIFRKIDNDGISNQIIDDEIVAFEITVSPLFFGEIKNGDYYISYVIIKDGVAYLVVYRNLDKQNYVTVYQAVNSEPVIDLSKTIYNMCQNSIEKTESELNIGD